MAHVHGRPDNQSENLDDILGRGPGDPDVHGHYPGDPDEANCELCNPKVQSQNIQRRTSTVKSIGAKRA